MIIEIPSTEEIKKETDSDWALRFREMVRDKVIHNMRPKELEEKYGNLTIFLNL